MKNFLSILATMLVLSWTYNAQAAERNEGIRCINKNTYVQAEWDDRRGQRSTYIKVNSRLRRGFECMGRCGSGCGKRRVASSWTKDCLDHDQCSNANNSSGGRNDPNCGDEWKHAADDWAFGVLRGCRG